MSREIKFRAFTGTEMLYDVIPVNDTAVITDMQGFPGEAVVLYRHDIKSIMQYIGLKDKNEVNIYQGDIVQTGTDKLMYIGWSDRFASFVIMREGWMFQHWFGEAFEGNDCKVVGNIHQNPNLLL